jgi:virginiamycin B lyase
VPVPSGAPHGARTACAGSGTVCGASCGNRSDGQCVYPTGACGQGPTCAAGTLASQGLCVAGACTSTSNVCSSGCNAGANACAEFTTFPILPRPTFGAHCAPQRITTGPDGNLWFTDSSCGRIGRITVTGDVTTFVNPRRNNAMFGIVAGPDGNMWVTDLLKPYVGRITTTGTLTETMLTEPYGAPGVAVSSTGLVWLAAFESVGRVTTATSMMWFPVPTPSSYVFDITAGPDANMWFTEEATGKIGRATDAGVITEFPVVPGSNAALRSIVYGPDGNLWVTEPDSKAIGRVSPDGLSVAHFQIPTGRPDGITVGADGNIWFTEWPASRIGRVTPNGTVTEFPVPGSIGTLTGITTGPDGNLWFLDSASSSEPNPPGNNVHRFKM